ncbi:MAG: DNA polymerase/3'-5' exonuclease PolX [Nitrospiria bacterium]
MTKEHLIVLFEESAMLMELKGESPFRCQAYAKAARVLAQFEGDLHEAVRNRSLMDYKGIGKAIFEKISEAVTTGRLSVYEALKAETPPGLIEMLKIKGLGPRKLRTIYQALGVKDLIELEYACVENRLVGLPGFGKKTQEGIREGISYLKKVRGFIHCHTARLEGEKLLTQLRRIKGALRADFAGALRRRSEVVKEIDLIVSSEDPSDLVHRVHLLPEIDDEVEATEETGQKSEGRLFKFNTKSGILVNLYVVPDDQFPYLLHHYTGSRPYHEAISDRARAMRMKVSGYGLFLDDHIFPCRDERDVFSTLELDYIPPELRENDGEVEAAAQHRLPELVEEKDIRGIFHVHSHYSDGAASISKMVEAAAQLGHEYIGISDHSKSAFYANGLKEDRILKQHEEIDRIQKRFPRIRIFKGIESDILPNGALDYDDRILSSFDFVIASVHSRFNMSEKEMTRRIVRAMRHPSVTFLGHPTGRILLSREGYPLNIPEVIKAARRYGVVIEINASPYRLDLDWRYCKLAKEAGVRLSINPDAHGIEGISDTTFGVGIARKGWLSKEDIINTLPLCEIERYLKGK